jgi:calcineurin-like phosphoesterase family protein
MSKRYIADQHFFDEDVRVKMDKRPFDNCEEKNSYMIDQWNSVVRGGDDVYVLGDMFDWKGAGSALPINKVLHKLKGRIVLLKGNHDIWLKKKDIDLERFEKIETQIEMGDKKKEVLLNHYPILFFGKNHTKSPDGGLKKFMLHGHVHDSPEAKLLYEMEEMAAGRSFETAHDGVEPMVCNLINCWCGYSDYKPLTLNEWINKSLQLTSEDAIAKRRS